MADDEDYAKTRFQTAIPRGLMPTHMPAATHMLQHTIGTVGEGRDKTVVSDTAPSPIVNGVAPASQSGGNIPDIIIVFNGTAFHCTLTGTVNAPV